MGGTPDHDAILVPTDGSERAQIAGQHAVGLADAYDATVHALYVMDMGDLDFVATPSDIAETRSRLREKGETYTDEIASMAEDEGVECVTAVEPGTIAEEIVEYAEEHDIDHIVMGKRGRADPDKPLIGSRTKRVVGMADMSVETL